MKEQEQEQHHKYSPSKLSIIINCPGYVSITRQLQDEGKIKDTTSEAAREGTVYHGIVEHILNNRRLSEPERKAYIKEVCEKEKVPVEYEAINFCVSYAEELILTTAATPLIEQKVSLSGFGIDCEGTADLIIQDDRYLHVIDWKFGKGVFVSADTPQGKTYTLGAAGDHLALQKFDKAIVHIVQPRFYGAEPVRTKEYTPIKLLQWCNDVLRPALLLAEQGGYQNPGEHCLWCQAKMFCKAKLLHELTTAKKLFTAYAKMEEAEDTVAIEDLAELYTHAEQIQGYIKAIGKYLYARLLEDEEVPGYKLVRGRSNRKWKNEEEVTKVLMELGLDTDDIFKTKLNGPSPILKLLPPEKRKDVETNHVIKPEGALKMALKSDYRDEVKPIEAIENMFNKYKEQ